MNNKKVYDQLITKAISEERSKNQGIYYELHHILPKSLGGTDQRDNMVLLTAREHFLAHWLLFRIHTGPCKHKMAHAFFRMCSYSYNQERVKNSRLYEYAKRAKSEATSVQFKGKKLSEETIRKRSSDNPRKVPVTIDGMYFNQTKDAASYFNTSTDKIRKYVRGDITLAELNDSTPFKSKSYDERYGKERAEKIKEKIGSKMRGKMYEEIFGVEKAIKLKETRAKSKLGKKHSEETKNKIAESKRGKPSWNKGKTASDATRKKLSENRKNNSRSYKKYKVVDSSGKEYLVLKKGLRFFWKNVLEEPFPTVFKCVTNYKEGKKGKWKGWKIYVLP